MAISTATVPGQILTSAYVNNNINSGLVYVTSATVGTGVSTVTVSNAFNTNYDNYVVQWVNGTSAASALVNIQLSGATTAAQYFSGLIDVNVSTGAVGGQGRNGTFAYADYCGYSTTTVSSVKTEIHNPFLAKPTYFYSSLINPTGATFPGTSWAYHNQSTSYTGFVMSVVGTTMTGGTIMVYGYRKV